jgi:hypothetical protein
VRSPFYRLKGSAYTERGPDRWTQRHIKSCTYWSLLCHRYRDLPLQLLPVVLDRKVDVRMCSQGMVMCHLTGIVPAVSDMHRGRRAATVGPIPADRRWGYVHPLHLLSIETHRRATTGNTRSREASWMAGGPRSLGQRPSDLAHDLAWSR